jgi:hypothetical protein
MKSILFAAALSVSSIALAQSTTDTQASTEDTQATTDATMTTDQGTATGTATGTGTMSTGTGTATATGTGTMSTDTGTATMSTQGSMSAGTAMSGGGGQVAPGNTNPETDARGIPVISAPADAPSGANAPVPSGATLVPAANQAQVFTTQQSTENYPACSRTVTDNCVQAYERGSRRR